MQLPFEVPAEAVAVSAENNRIVLNFPDLEGALRMWKPFATPARRAEMADRIQAGLEAIGVTLDIRVKDRLLGSLGTGANPGLLRRLLGF